MMSWADNAIKELNNGSDVTIRPRGNSMNPKIKSGALVSLVPLLDTVELKVNDIVLCKVRGSVYLHLVKALKGDQYQIGNNRGGINGWITRNSIYGICVNIDNSASGK